MACMAVAVGVRAASCTTAVPRRTRSVWAAIQASGVKASDPQASAVQIESKPSRSASWLTPPMSAGGSCPQYPHVIPNFTSTAPVPAPDPGVIAPKSCRRNSRGAMGQRVGKPVTLSARYGGSTGMQQRIWGAALAAVTGLAVLVVTPGADATETDTRGGHDRPSTTRRPPRHRPVPSDHRTDTDAASVDTTPPVLGVTLSSPVISPNGDGRLDRLTVQVTVDEAVALSATVRQPHRRGARRSGH